MNTAIHTLLDILDLERLEENLFRGRSPQVGWQRVFGGQVIGQALVAASRTVVEDRHVHSLHGYFLRPGDPEVPIIYEVDRIRDGGSFTTRRVVAIQHGHAIFSMSASFQIAEEGLEHQVEMPQVPQPDDLPGDKDLKEKFLSIAPENVRKYWERERPIELRPVDLTHYFSKEKLPPRQYVWVRATGVLPDDERIHQCVLAYASDMTLLDTSLFPHGTSVFSPKIQAASLDHAMWFHQRFRADEWLLYATDSTQSGGARGLNRGMLFTQDGKLVASTAQEGLIRLRRKPEN
ncbi:acyl-CoA thioesterase II [Roseibium aquae]|uniref:Acyl-CoA thioesterase 2 n=1 Tax=Roseibium aquae TaxID=1323746 RepID=A0A916TCG2_9HYPH|nr:acyl-CoA thioesterase II [Roseibium aquae]GGB39884.1 acyl-CoA thioesterase II [Roseibium aquae]